MTTLYQQYRPKRFQDILGQPDVTRILHSQSVAHSWHHSYLLYGKSGTGKTSTARVLAMALNCETMNGTGEPCGICDACRLTAASAHWDCLELDGGRFRGIDAVKDLCYKACFSPIGRQKVYILDECHQLTPEAWGAMLHLLEEPPDHLTVILCTTEIDKIPETIQSRCELYPFKALEVSAVTGKLAMILKSRNLSASREVLESIANRAGGNMRMAENLLGQCMA